MPIVKIVGFIAGADPTELARLQAAAEDAAAETRILARQAASLRAQIDRCDADHAGQARAVRLQIELARLDDRRMAASATAQAAARRWHDAKTAKWVVR